MSFFAFQVLFAVLAIALVVAMVFLVRGLRRRGQANAPAATRKKSARAKPASQPKASPKGQARGGFARGRAKPAAEVEDEITPATPRRRQLASFAENERAATRADPDYGDPLPGEQASFGANLEDEPAADHGASDFAEAPPAEPLPIDPAAPEPAGEDRAWPDPAGFEQATLARLEAEFEALQAGEIDLSVYRERLIGVQTSIEDHIAAHQESGDELALEGGLAARESVRWCLDWAEEQSLPR
jgi:hypothetical protein